MVRKRPIIVISCGGSAAAMKRDQAAAWFRKWRAEGVRYQKAGPGRWRVKEEHDRPWSL